MSDAIDDFIIVTEVDRGPAFAEPIFQRKYKASVPDFARWSGLTIAEATVGLGQIRPDAKRFAKLNDRVVMPVLTEKGVSKIIDRFREIPQAVEGFSAAKRPAVPPWLLVHRARCPRRRLEQGHEFRFIQHLGTEGARAEALPDHR